MEIKLLSCPLCMKPHFQDVDSLRLGLINAATTHLSCPVCNESLLGLDKLTIHLFTHISELSKKEEKICDDPSPVKESAEPINSIDIELPEVQTDNKKSGVSCDICNFRLHDETILEMHQKLLHQTAPDKKTGKYSYHCHLCSKKFKMRGSLMVHLRVAHYGFMQQINDSLREDANDANFSESPKATTSPKMQEKQWECDVCSKMFTTKYFLKKHKRLHTGEMPYFCAQCNKSFTFQQSYHKHMLYHSSDKPHTCNECGRAFKELSTLHNHERIHSGERPFACETCGKCFRQRVSYLVHRRIHTGVMPYKCTACDKSFRYKVSQRSHKCPANPPGSVVRTENLINTEGNVIKLNLRPDNNMDTDLITITYDLDLLNQKLDKPSTPNFVTEQLTNETETVDNSNSNQDFFSMILSPVLSDVQSLHLSNPNKRKCTNKDLQTINEESLKELLYGPN